MVRDFQFGDQDSIIYEGVKSKVQASVNARTAVLRGVSASMNYKIHKHLTFAGSITYSYGQGLDADVPLITFPLFLQSCSFL